MTRSRLSPLPFLAVALALFAAPSRAQEVVQALPGTTDADKLADDIRTLGANPRDVDALVDAARLSLRLDDISGAASLLQRAENVDPRNPRVKAVQGSVLVQSERPGQALRYFAQAEAAGLDPRNYAADRGLAYDLTGEQARAQRDYARALRDDPDNAEIIRRYALSLGISGERQRAVALLDPLVRKSDRAAWRAQAFVLAMTGDVGGASRIAATMIPGGAAGLSAFFERLPTLSPIDRAFAVHFGEVRPSPERLADARLAPAPGPLGRETGAAIASARPLPAAPVRSPERLRPASPAPVVTAAALPRRVPPQNPTPAPSRAAPAVAVAQAPVAVAALPPAAVRPAPVRVPVPAPAQTPPLVRTGTPVGPVPTRVAADTPAPTPAAVTARPAPVLAEAREPAGTVVTAAVPSPTPAPVAPAASAPVQLAATTPVASPPVVETPAPRPVQAVAPPASAPVASAAPSRSLASARASEDTILARIIANLSIPGSELGVGEPERATAAVAETPRAAPVPLVAKVDTAAADKLAAERLAADKLAAAKAAADRKAAAAKAAADRKALAEKKAAAEAKAIADREAAEKKRAERANPPRIWVQVAGGAYEGDLPKAYAGVKARAPAVFGSRGGWTTPLRATNRVLAGPFKTDAEARAFVNDLKKQGVSAFTFTSDAGQPVKRLGGG